MKSLFLALFVLFSINVQAYWQPSQGLTWDIQYEGTINPNLNVQVRNIDLEDTSQSLINQMKANGQKIICYFSAGSAENWRSDYWKFPASIKGNNLSGWAGEKWVDVRQLSILMPIMTARMDVAVSKGCDAVDPDNMDAYSNNSGFNITRSHSEAYFTALATEAHNRGLAISLKNSMEMIPNVLSLMDFAVNEQCKQYSECNTYDSVISSGKPVFGIEYKGDPAKFCPIQNAIHHETLKKYLSLNAWRIDCKNY